ncbi:MAG: porphobilinogen synthase [Tissierellia bacterium]|nr:porphobilinogen synthase [Tissierellia bacterium]
MKTKEFRLRRLRGRDGLRKLVRETRLSVSSLIFPIFVEEGDNIYNEIKAMPGQFRYSIDNLPRILDRLIAAGIRSIMLFGIPKEKDEVGSQAYSENGIIQEAIRYIKREYPELYIITDVCLSEYTSHGHCGILKGEEVDNDPSVDLIAKSALSHVKAGADMVAPSDMMDHRVGAIREVFDKSGFENIPIMAYSAKYSSSFYGPFREAAGSAPAFGNRKTYQMDYHNRREGLQEGKLDILEGADILMVKPALAYLDLISDFRREFDHPLCAYSVSGEYSMIKAAAAANYMNEKELIAETAVSIFRAGADMLLTYYAIEIAELIKDGIIG